MVEITPPANLANGCTETIIPNTYAIGTGDGQLTVTYTLGGGATSPDVTGGGVTIWIANVTLTCPNVGSSSTMSPVQAQWWPVAPTGVPTPVTAEDGVLDATYSNQGAAGTVHLFRQ